MTVPLDVAEVAPDVRSGGLVTGRTSHLLRCRDALGNGTLGNLLVPQGLSQAADAISLLLLAQLLVFNSTDGPSTSGMLRAVASAVLPIVIVGPIAGAVADRWSRRDTLIYGHLARSAITAACVLVPLSGQRWVGYTALAALISVTRVLYTSRAAALPHLVRREELVTGDSLVLMVGMIAGVVGGGLGALAAWSTPTGGLIAAATVHLVAARLYRRLPVDLGGGAGAGHTPWAAAMRELQVATTRAAISATVFHRALLGAGVASVVGLIDEHYDVRAPGYALTLAISAVGSFAGTLTATRAAALTRTTVTALACAVGGLAFLASAALPVPAVALGAVIVASFGFQNLRVCADATVQATAHDAAVGRVFAAYDVMYNAAFAVGAVTVLLFASSREGGTMLAGIGILYLLGGAAWAAAGRRGGKR